MVLLFCGVRNFAELGPAWTNRFISARRARVSFLDPEEVTHPHTKPIPEFYLCYAAGAVEEVIEATRCQPFLVHAVAYELVRHMSELQRGEATCVDAREAITQSLESGGEHFADRDSGKPHGGSDAPDRHIACCRSRQIHGL